MCVFVSAKSDNIQKGGRQMVLEKASFVTAAWRVIWHSGISAALYNPIANGNIPPGLKFQSCVPNLYEEKRAKDAAAAAVAAALELVVVVKVGSSVCSTGFILVHIFWAPPHILELEYFFVQMKNSICTSSTAHNVCSHNYAEVL